MNIEYPHNYSPIIFIQALILFVLPLALFYIRKVTKKTSRYRVIITIFLILISIISVPLLLFSPLYIFGGFEGPGMWYSFAELAIVLEMILLSIFGITLLIKKFC